MLVQGYVSEGDVVVDATCGNGYDTLSAGTAFSGKASYAFHIQQEAVDATRKRLREAGFAEKLEDGTIEVICDSHEHLTDHVKTFIQAAVFNLGSSARCRQRLHNIGQFHHAGCTKLPFPAGTRRARMYHHVQRSPCGTPGKRAPSGLCRKPGQTPVALCLHQSDQSAGSTAGDLADHSQKETRSNIQSLFSILLFPLCLMLLRLLYFLYYFIRVNAGSTAAGSVLRRTAAASGHPMHLTPFFLCFTMYVIAAARIAASTNPPMTFITLLPPFLSNVIHTLRRILFWISWQ